jgi:hypothetical protein
MREGRGGESIDQTEASPISPRPGEPGMAISRLQYGVRVLLGICLLSWTVPPAPAQPKGPGDQDLKRRETLRCTSTDDTIPSGLAVVLPSGRYHSLNLQALNNSFISGVAVQINWRDLEPVQGTPDWSKLDDLFAAAESSKKWVQLLIFPGFFSPGWALEGGAETDLFPIQYGPGRGSIAKLPMPWDGVYLGRWFAFLKQLSERYRSSSPFRMIAADGPTSVSAE